VSLIQTVHPKCAEAWTHRGIVSAWGLAAAKSLDDDRGTVQMPAIFFFFFSKNTFFFIFIF
jgi:hypothetical protein